MVARLVWDQKVGGSNPSTPTIFNHFCNNMHDISHFISLIVKATSIQDLLNPFVEQIACFGITHYNYTTFYNAIMYHNYSKPWIEKYRIRDYNLIDPAIHCVKTYNKIFAWENACSSMNNIHLNKMQKVILLDMQNGVKTENMEYGICIPLPTYPFGQNAIYIAFSSKKKLQDKNLIYQILATSTIFNNAFSDMIKLNEAKNPKNNDFPFSQNEKKIIELIYQGKERYDIAEILDVSVNTIDTVMKRIFVKMRVNSKIQLITRIILNGWIHTFCKSSNDGYHAKN